MKTLLVALNAHYMHTSLALRQLSVALSDAGHEITTIESHINQPFDSILRDIGRQAADIFAFSCYIWNIDYVLKLVRALKKIKPNSIIALGGPEVAYDAEYYLDKHSCIDYILCGEGEALFPKFIDMLRYGHPWQQGLAGRVEGKIKLSGFAECIPVDRWVNPYPQGISQIMNRILYVETSRGCPFNCQYCLSSAQSGVRSMRWDDALNMLINLADQGAKLVKLVDRTFNFDINRAYKIWSGLLNHAQLNSIKTTFHFEIAAELMNEESILLLAKAPSGLFQFEIGVQTTDPDVLENIKRKGNFEKISKVVKELDMAGNIHLHLDLIAGLPGEDMVRFERSFNDVYSLLPGKLQLGFLKLLRGSGLRNMANENGMLYMEDTPYEVLATREMSFNELSHLKDIERVLEWYSNSGKYEATIKLLLKDISPFLFFSSLVNYFRDYGFFKTENAEAARINALYNFAKGQGANELWLSATLRWDFSSFGRRVDLPYCLQYVETPKDKQDMYQYIRPVRGQCIEVFEVDVLKFLKTGEQKEKKHRILFDHKNNFFKELPY